MLAKEYRLRLEKDIKTLFTKGKSVFGPLIGMKFRPNRLSVSRFAVVVGTKVSKKAVVRNRLRRQLRAIIYKHLFALADGFDVMLMVKKEAIGKKSSELEAELLALFKKSRLQR